MKNKFITLFIIVLIGLMMIYRKLAAEQNGFSDTVILKDGTVLEGVKTTDWFIITTEEGETMVYKKKEIYEIKKGSSKKEKSKSKKERKILSGNWSEYQGAMDWDEATRRCSELGMRLPTIDELRLAYLEGITESWKKDGLYYWSSTPGEGDHSLNLGINNAHFFVDDRGFINEVRCIR